ERAPDSRAQLITMRESRDAVVKTSERAGRVPPSETLAITARAKELKQQGIDVVSFGAGEPDFGTPDHIGDAAKAAIDAGETRYTSGISELKEAIVAAVERDMGLKYEVTNVCCSIGAKHALHTLCQCICDPGDEIIIFAPYWVSYPPMIGMADGVTKIVNTTGENGFVPDVADVEAQVTDKTAAIVINSPSNPTGAVFSRDAMQGLADVAVRHDLLIVSDECYDKIVFDGLTATSPATLGDAVRERTLVVNSASKTYAMTGWRVGWTVGPEDIIKAMGAYQSHETSNPCSIAEMAAAAGLLGDQDFVEHMRQAFEERRDYVVQRCDAIDGVTLPRPQGAFYAFPDVSSHYGRTLNGREVTDSASLIQYLLEDANVAAVPGAPFGADAHIRISFATSMEQLEKGFDRIEAALK
ncbi:MAG: pyridoxal phosphate-dependent aminotransferase, partial [Armatimonadota bacterium]